MRWVPVTDVKELARLTEAGLLTNRTHDRAARVPPAVLDGGLTLEEAFRLAQNAHLDYGLWLED